MPGEMSEPAAEMSTEVPMPAAKPIQIDRTEMANGAVLVSQTNQDSPLVAIHLTVRGRAMIDRDNAQAGALDLVHRLLDQGVAGCDNACLAQRLRELGAVVKRVDDPRIPMDNYYTNGRFSFIRIETVAEFAPQVLELLTELIQHATFDDDDFLTLVDDRQQVLARRQTGTRHTANRLLDEALYGEHPLLLPAEGSVESLSELSFNEARVVYRRAFSPENLIFSIVGPQSHESLRQTLEDLLPGRGQPAPGLPPLPITRQARTVTQSVGGDMAAIRLGSIISVAEADGPALRLLTAVLSDRLAMDLRETRGLSYSVGASLNVWGGMGEFTAWLNPPTDRLAEGDEALAAAIAEFDAASITAEELDLVRSARTGRMMMRRLSSMGQAYYLAMAELDDNLSAYLQALTMYDSVTLNDLQRVAEAYLAPMPLVKVVVD